MNKINSEEKGQNMQAKMMPKINQNPFSSHGKERVQATKTKANQSVKWVKCKGEEMIDQYGIDNLEVPAYIFA